jgi:predicted nucleic acid-binding protein
LRVADSSFIVEALLKRKELFQEDLVTVDLAVYESVNSIWKHQFLIKDLDDGVPYVSLLYGFIEAGRIMVIHPGEDLMKRGYSLAAKHKLSIYDATFVALAQELDLELATFDKRQDELMRGETGK